MMSVCTQLVLLLCIHWLFSNGNYRELDFLFFLIWKTVQDPMTKLQNQIFYILNIDFNTKEDGEAKIWI